MTLSRDFFHGLGGAIQNFELQKGGSEAPQVYRARLYLRQLIGLGGEQVKGDSNPMQLGVPVDRRRIASLTRLARQTMPNAADYNPDAQISANLWPRATLVWSIAYNPELVKDPPKTWMERLVDRFYLPVELRRLRGTAA